jgi:NADH dehydrogenase
MGNVGQIQPMRAVITNPASVRDAVRDAEVVINLVGILAERRPGDFMRIQGEAAGSIAREAAAAGVRRLVQLSAIGADAASPSAYARSKAAGEAAVLAAFPEAVILRPSIVFGPDDAFFNRFAAMAAALPFLPVIHGDTKFQPVFVGDVAAAVMAAVQHASRARVFELGGPDILSMRDLMAWIADATHRRPRLVPIPNWLASVQASVLERLPGKMLTRDQLLLLARDNVADPTLPGLAALGVSATPIALVVPAYLARFRPA